MSTLSSENFKKIAAPSIFSELMVEKSKARQNGQNLIDLSIGSPDLPPPAIVMDVLSQAVSDPTMYGYTVTGLPDFNQAVASFYHLRYDVSLNPTEEVLQLMGSQDGLVHLAMAVLNPGDLVLCPDPGYPVYESSVRLAGAQVYPMPLYEENGFLPNLGAIPADVASRAKIMVINYPGNPVTALAPASFYREVVAFAKRHDILVVHDFAYSELVFDGRRAESFLSVPGAIDVGVEFNSLSKTFHMAGCRIAYIAGNRSVIRTLAMFKSHIDFGVFRPIQLAGIAALTSGVSFLDTLVTEYVRRREVVCSGLTAAGWRVSPSQATMFVWARVPEGWTSRAFTLQLLQSTGVVVTPGDAFGKNGEGYVRLALVQPVNRLQEAVTHVERFLRTGAGPSLSPRLLNSP